MAQWRCDRCCGTGWANAAMDSGTENMPPMLQQIGVYSCPKCGGSGSLGLTDEDMELILKTADRLSSNAIVSGLPRKGDK